MIFRRGFWNGMLTGGIIGAIGSLFISPERKPTLRRQAERMGDTVKEWEEEAREVADDVKDSVTGLWRK